MRIIKNQTLATCFLLICTTLMSFAQVAKTDDAGRIVLNAYVPDQIENMPEAAKALLKNKLDQIVTQVGMGGSSFNPRFIITANVNILTKDLTPTAPPMTAMTTSITFYIGDGMEGTKFATKSIDYKGVGTNETKAYIECIKQIKPANPELQAFVESGKKKIMEYYTAKCDFIIKEAETFAAQNNFDEAIYRLTLVPDVCKECYDKCMTAVTPMYKKKQERDCKVNIAKAKAIWTATPDLAGAESIAQLLGAIDPEASCYKEAEAFSATVGKRVKELNQRDWDFKMKVYNNDVDITKQQINAIRDVGVAYGNGQPKSIVYNTKGWF